MLRRISLNRSADVKEFINPNWHVIFIHYPLALLLIGVLIELFSFLWRAGTLRVAGRWMILLGALSMAPALLSGIYALHDVVLMNNPADEYASWNERITASPITREQWDLLQRHVWLQVAATATALLTVVVYLGSSDRVREKLYYPMLVLLLISVGLMSSGAWFSGEAVYRHQVATGVSQTPHVDEPRGAAFFAPPIELHLTLAGFALAAVLGSIGLSYRTAAVALESNMLSQRPVDPNDPVDPLVRSLNPDALLRDIPHTIPAARFWLLAALLLACTALAGAWYLAIESETWDVKSLWLNLSEDSEHLRRLVHVIGGLSLVVLALVMSGIARWAPHRRGWLSVVVALLVLVLTVQIYLGLLMLFDSPMGPIAGINP